MRNMSGEEIVSRLRRRVLRPDDLSDAMVMAQALTLAADVPRASEKQIDEMNRAGLASAVLSYFEWPASLDDDLDERDQREGFPHRRFLASPTRFQHAMTFA